MKLLGTSRDNWLRFVIWSPPADRSIALRVPVIGADRGRGDRTANAYFVGSRRQWPRLEPERAGRDSRINPDLPPPCGLIAAVVNFTMVPSAQGDGELIADLAPERLELREPKMMGIRRLAAAD